MKTFIRVMRIVKELSFAGAGLVWNEKNSTWEWDFKPQTKKKMRTKIIEVKPPENLSIARSVAPNRPIPSDLWYRWLNITHYSRRKTHE